MTKQAEYSRRWRAAHREEAREEVRRRQAANPDKHTAQQAVYRAVKRGVLVREPCLFCDEPNVHGHHHNYTQPLVVTWLCPAHHALAHKAAA